MHTSRSHRTARAAVLALLMSSVAGAALAQDPRDARIAALEAQLRALSTEVAALKAAPPAAAAPAAPAAKPDAKIAWKGAPEFSNGDFRFKPRGRVFLDFVHQDVEGGASVADLRANNTRIRTARLGVEGDLTDKIGYVAEVAINNGSAEWEDLLLEYAATEKTTLSLGNFKTVSLENLTSSRYITFMERGPFNDALGLGRTLNLGASTGGERWTLSGALSGDNINDLDVAGDEMVGMSARATFAPVVTDTTRVHLGGWVRRRDRGNDDALRYRVRPNTNYGARYVDTGAIGRSDTTFGLEAAAVLGSVSFQGEYGRLEAEGNAGGDVGIDTWYAFASWFPTGEMRNYSPTSGAFSRVKIKRPVTDGGPGAVELAVRYDHADLSDAFRPLVASTFRSGEYDGITVGANWYPTTYVRFMANYTRGQNDNPVDAFDADTDTLQLRAQFDF